MPIVLLLLGLVFVGVGFASRGYRGVPRYPETVGAKTSPVPFWILGAACLVVGALALVGVVHLGGWLR